MFADERFFLLQLSGSNFLIRIERIAKARLLTIAPANAYKLTPPRETEKCGSKDIFRLARTTPKIIGARVAFT